MFLRTRRYLLSSNRGISLYSLIRTCSSVSSLNQIAASRSCSLLSLITDCDIHPTMISQLPDAIDFSYPDMSAPTSFEGIWSARSEEQRLNSSHVRISYAV